ncbi:diacylglycerol/lipid kinase family protein [Gynurincola endophyticus]|uniref:diacylglycerol/lipid kinase family protein n=1 Tax=Gynurincola endophyticus TaxID=2479004 RepID=UPI000F8E1DDA|nr:YegS/Rv2252/BmrU family lipid kinase [Gynurincola endophyticus]
MRKIIYLVNPKSGTQKKDDLIELIKSATTEKKIEFVILPTPADGNYIGIKEKIQQENFTDIVICGGDGTVNQAINALADTKAHFGIIPMGSGNGLALSAGLSVTAKKALDTIFNGVARYTDAFLVNEQFGCMLCGLGFDATIAHQFARSSRRGLTTYATLTTKNFLNSTTWDLEFEVEGKKFHTDAFFVSIANSNQFGNNITIAPEAELTDGLLDIVIVKKTVKPVLIMQVLQQILTGKVKEIEKAMDNSVAYFQTQNLRIINKQLAPIHIDGEPKEAMEDITIKILPNHFKLIFEQ